MFVWNVMVWGAVRCRLGFRGQLSPVQILCLLSIRDFWKWLYAINVSQVFRWVTRLVCVGRQALFFLNLLFNFLVFVGQTCWCVITKCHHFCRTGYEGMKITQNSRGTIGTGRWPLLDNSLQGTSVLKQSSKSSFQGSGGF